MHPEDMPVYKDAMRLLDIAELEAARIMHVRPDLADQLRRAASSVVLNIREGATEYAPREKMRTYRYGKREAGECAAAFEIIVRIRLGSADTEEGRRLAVSIVGQLNSLIHAVAARIGKPSA